ncbi:MAG TPA: hypothetical protein VGK27_01310 [Candidatus Deferrimicrobiaceae bacterium]
MNVLVIDDGETLRGYDCREVLRVDEPAGGGELPFIVHFGRAGSTWELCCRNVLGFYPLSAADIRPLPLVLKERLTQGEGPWAVGITPGGLCLLY